MSAAFAGGSDTVREKARHYQELALLYKAAAATLGNEQAPAVAYTDVDSKQQYCMVLIDLLGISPGTSSQSVQGDPGLDSKDPNELMLFSLSLTSYVSASASLLQESDFAWRYKWNLNCAGVYGADKWLKIKDQPPYTVTISNDGRVLRVVGGIEAGLYSAIAKRLVIHKSIDTVEVASMGGLGPDAFKIGRLLRKLKITTVVSSNCNSACALIFLGGVKRIVPAPYWELGFHRASRGGVAIWDGDKFYSEQTEYMNEMIGRGNDLLRRSFIPEGLDFYRPSRRDLCWRNIATVVEGVCEAGSETDKTTDGLKNDLN